MMAGAGGCRELGGSARQPPGFNNSVRGLVHLYCAPPARAEALMMAGAGGCREPGGSARAVPRFQQPVRGLVHLYCAPLARAKALMMAGRWRLSRARG